VNVVARRIARQIESLKGLLVIATKEKLLVKTSVSQSAHQGKVTLKVRDARVVSGLVVNERVALEDKAPNKEPKVVMRNLHPKW
jgi:hypothetical protein